MIIKNLFRLLLFALAIVSCNQRQIFSQDRKNLPLEEPCLSIDSLFEKCIDFKKVRTLDKTRFLLLQNIPLVESYKKISNNNCIDSLSIFNTDPVYFNADFVNRFEKISKLEISCNSIIQFDQLSKFNNLKELKILTANPIELKPEKKLQNSVVNLKIYYISNASQLTNRFTKLRDLEFNSIDFTLSDFDSSFILTLSNIERIKFDHCNINNEMVKLLNFSGVKYINFYMTKVSKASAIELKMKHPNIEIIYNNEIL